MYGFGDDPIPRNDTVELLEEMVTEYLTEVVIKCQNLFNMLLVYFNRVFRQAN